MKRVWVPWLIALSLLGLGTGTYVWWKSRQPDPERRRQAHRQEREARARQRQTRVEAVTAQLKEESASLMPSSLLGVELGQTLKELRDIRRVTPSDLGNDPALRYVEERLQSGAQVLYALEPSRHQLVQIQVLSRMDVEGLAPHITAMTEHYGTPTGVWDCSAESAAGVPTRRFTWRHDEVTVQDVVLVYPTGVSVTLYIAPTAMIAQSLQLNRCQPVRSKEQLESFPVAAPEQLRAR